jgi:TonB family protein
MNARQPNQTPQYELKGELARFCLPAANRDPNRKLAWVNSLCLLFLLIGVLGAKRGVVSLKPPPPLEQVLPVVIEPVVPPQTSPENPSPDQTEPEHPDTPHVVVVTPDSPKINFAVPTIGNILAPNSLAQAPPLQPLQPPAPLKTQPTTLDVTGAGGDRPQPAYPPALIAHHEQGIVTLLLTADNAGGVASVELSSSSGFAALDHYTMDYIKRHWTLPTAKGGQLFQVSVNYKLE